MPDLSVEGVAKYWHEYQDPMIYRVVKFMEGVEKWTHDTSPEVEKAIETLGKQLDEIGEIDIEALGNQRAFIDICNHISTPRALRLLQAIDMAHPGSASRLLIHSEETSQHPDDPEGIFLRRNIVFERLRLLGRVFTSERFDLVMRALEGEERD